MASININSVYTGETISKIVDLKIRNVMTLAMTRDYIAHDMAVDCTVDVVDDVFDTITADVVDTHIVQNTTPSPLIEGIVIGLIETLLFISGLIISGFNDSMTTHECISIIGTIIAVCCIGNSMVMWEIGHVRSSMVSNYVTLIRQLRTVWHDARTTVENLPIYGSSSSPNFVHYVDMKFFGGYMFRLEPDDQLAILQMMIDYLIQTDNENDHSEDVASHFKKMILTAAFENAPNEEDDNESDR